MPERYYERVQMYREGRIKPPQSKLGPKKVDIQVF